MRNFLILVMLVIPSFLIAQEKIKWGSPTEWEKEMTACNFDSSANAVILSESGTIDFVQGFAYIKIYRKIKILNSNGLESANIKIPFYHKENMEEIKDLKAQTLNFENGRLIKIPLDKNDFFTKIINSRWSEERFTFPAAKAGSILEYRYTLVTKRITFLNAWEFQHEIPVVSSEVRVNVPSYLTYSVLMYGDNLKLKYHSGKNDNNTWSLNNIRGYEDEKHVFCYDDYTEKLQFQLLSYEAYDDQNPTKGVYTVNVLKDWRQLAGDMWDVFKVNLSHSGKVKEILDTLIRPSDSRMTKIKKIYHLVNSYFNWNNEYHIIPEKSTANLLSSRLGNSADLNLLLCLMLNETGIESFPVLISTKYNGKVTQNYPLLDQFNHVIVAIQNGTDYQFTDAVSDNKNCFMVPNNHINYFGYLISKNDSKWINIDYPVKSAEDKSLTCTFDTSGVHVRLVKYFSGYYAAAQRNDIRNHKENSSELPNIIHNTSLKKDSVEYKFLDDDYIDLKESSYFSSPVKYGDKIYLTPNIDQEENPFREKIRSFPVEFNFPFKKSSNYYISIPSGYSVNIVPKSLTLKIPGDAGHFSYDIRFDGNNIRISVDLEITSAILPAEYYFHLKEFYDQIISKLNEPIIMEKNL